MLLSTELMEIHFLGKHKSFDATVLQQAEVGKNIMHKPKKWSEVSPVLHEGCKQDYSGYRCGGQLEKKGQAARSCPPAEDIKY